MRPSVARSYRYPWPMATAARLRRVALDAATRGPQLLFRGGWNMRRIVFAALAIAAGGCIVTGGRPMERDTRDDRLSRQLQQQERWAQQALEARPTQEQLDRIRAGDQAAVN